MTITAAPLRRFLTAVTFIVLSGCTDGGHYVVLLPRAGEIGHTLSTALPPAATPRPPDPELIAQLAKLQAQARAGVAAFEQQRGALLAQIAAARGAPAGSEAWVVGQQALSALESARGPTLVARGAVDNLALHALDQHDSGMAEIDKAQHEIVTLAESQDSILRNAQAALAPATTGGH